MDDPFDALRSKLQEPVLPACGRHVLLLALGDSVTLGLTTNPELLQDRTYHALLRTALSRLHPRTAFSSVNAGVNGDSAAGGLRRFQRDVLDRHPDLLIVGYGLNDSGRGPSGLAAFARDLGSMVGAAHAAGIATILMTPNWMATRETGRVDPHYRHALASLIERQSSGLLGAYADAVRQVGVANGAPVADVYAVWERNVRQGRDMMEHLANGLNHPDAAGHRLASRVLLRTLQRRLGDVRPALPASGSAP